MPFQIEQLPPSTGQARLKRAEYAGAFNVPSVLLQWCIHGFLVVPAQLL
jgi:hypothetical protein